jgi:hypothetical protein
MEWAASNLAIWVARTRVEDTAWLMLRSQVAAIANWMNPRTDIAAVISRKKSVAGIKSPKIIITVS